MKKNPTLEARRFEVYKADQLAKWCHGAKRPDDQGNMTELLVGGHTVAHPGDYIVKEERTFTVLNPEQFDAKYLVVGYTEDRGYILVRERQQATHTVELGGQVFTEEQWDAVQTYARGHSTSAVQDATYVNPMQAAVVEFQRAMGLPVLSVATPLPKERIGLRVQLIEEEFEELQEALAAGDLVETADACVDLLYVVFGLMVETGLDARVLFDEVHRSNMSKFGEDGKPIIAEENDPDGIFPGRVKKGPNYFRPNLAGIIANDMAHLEA